MTLKKGKAAIDDLLEEVKKAGTVSDVEKLTARAHGFVTFAELDEKSSRISKTEGNALAQRIDAAKALRLKQLATG